MGGGGGGGGGSLGRISSMREVWMIYGTTQCLVNVQEWMAGDVIGCCIDLDEGTISYSR